MQMCLSLLVEKNSKAAKVPLGQSGGTEGQGSILQPNGNLLNGEACCWK